MCTCEHLQQETPPNVLCAFTVLSPLVSPFVGATSGSWGLPTTPVPSEPQLPVFGILLALRGERGAGGLERHCLSSSKVSLEELLEAHRSSLAVGVLNPLHPVKLLHLLAGRKI